MRSVLSHLVGRGLRGSEGIELYPTPTSTLCSWENFLFHEKFFYPFFLFQSLNSFFFREIKSVVQLCTKLYTLSLCRRLSLWYKFIIWLHLCLKNSFYRLYLSNWDQICHFGVIFFLRNDFFYFFEDLSFYYIFIFRIWYRLSKFIDCIIRSARLFIAMWRDKVVP